MAGEAEKRIVPYPLELTVCFLCDYPEHLSSLCGLCRFAGSPRLSLDPPGLHDDPVFFAAPAGPQEMDGSQERLVCRRSDAVVLLTLAVQVYTLWDLDAFIFRRGDLSQLDIYAGTVLLILLLEATRRAVGWAMVIIAGFFIIQTAFSDHFFGIFYGPPSSWFTMIDYLFMRENGIYSIPLMVMATYIFLFILFGAILVRSGAGRFFINVALALTGSKVGGPAKASVVSSCLMAIGFRLGRGQCGDHRQLYHPADETYRLPALFRRCGGSLRFIRRSDHAAGNGGGGLRDRRVSQHALPASGRCRPIPGPDLLFFNLCHGSFRGTQAQPGDDLRQPNSPISRKRSSAAVTCLFPSPLSLFCWSSVTRPCLPHSGPSSRF